MKKWSAFAPSMRDTIDIVQEDIKSSIKISDFPPELIKQAEKDIEHLQTLRAAASRADAGDTINITDFTDEELMAFFAK